MKKILFILILFSTFANAQRAKDSTILANGGHCILLDFDGQTVPSRGVVATASPIAGDATAMDSVVNYVAEYYLPFGMVVTRDSTLYWIAKDGKRHRVVLSPTASFYGSVLGQTPIGDSVSFVNSSLATTAQIRGRTAAHEIGHQFGMYHFTSGGGGVGQDSWWPLMRASIQVSINMQTWSKGTNENTDSQDDIKILTIAIGAKSDDGGNSISSAKYLRKNQVFTGVIGISDNDYYKIEIPSSQTVSISGVPWSNGASNANANLDVAIDLYDYAGNLITSSANTTTLNATISQSLAAGTYYIRVRPDTGNSNNPTGYGFMGHYTINYTY